MTMPILELDGINKSYGPLEVIKELNLSIREGEFFTLLGPSGCGKTTILRLIAGLEEPEGGRLMLQGQDITRLPAHRRNINTVFQNYALFPHLTVYANIAFGLEMKGFKAKEIEDKVVRFMRLFNIDELGERLPQQISGGQQQRVAVARALVCNPQILLLDEPLAALDLKLRKQIQLELKSLQRETGITFIYVTHDQEEALLLSDRIGVMFGGNIVQLGTPQEIYRRPLNRFVADFIGESNLLAVEVMESRGNSLYVKWLDKIFSSEVVEGPEGPATYNGKALFMLRPEELVIAKATEGANGKGVNFPGRITEVFYCGSGYKVRVEVDGQADLTVLSFSNDWEPGESVDVGWRAGSGLIIQD